MTDKHKPTPIARANAILCNGEKVPVWIINLGFDKRDCSYKTIFRAEEWQITSSFKCDFYGQFECPTPNIRLSFDMKGLEDAIAGMCGSPMVELEIVE